MLVEKEMLVASVNKLFGGAKEDRTPDLFAASEALSQLSYSPEQQACMILGCERFVYINLNLLSFILAQ